MDYELNFYLENQEIHPERILRDRLNPIEFYEQDEIKRLFRFNVETINYITGSIFNELRRNTLRNKSLTPIQQVCVALRFYATGGMQLSLASWINIDQSTVSRVTWDVTQAILNALNNVAFPENMLRLKQKYFQVSGMRNVIGCIDGTHIPVQQPTEHGVEYLNRKNWYSINVQCICDSDCKFLDIVAAWPGSVHDSRVFRNSRVYDKLMNRELDGILLGDSGYPLLPFLLTPYRNPVGNVQTNFNYVHSRVRNGIERSFGQLKRRFACLQNPLRIKIDRIPSTILVCAILHNIAKDYHDDIHDDFDNINVINNNQPANEDYNANQDRHLRIAGENIRNEIAQTLIA